MGEWTQDELDLRGLKCPLPALMARRALRAAAPGGAIRVVTDDPMAPIDVPHMCRQEGYEAVSVEREGDVARMILRRPLDPDRKPRDFDAMSDVKADVRPILEMFAQQLRHPNVGNVLKDWRNTLSKGMLHFGRKEALDKGIDFNTLIYTELNPTPSKSGRRLTLEPKLELIGVISNATLGHKQFRYLQNEMIILRASGRWDYARNEGPYDLKIVPDLTVRLPEGGAAVSRAASEKVVKEIGRLCFSWLVLNKMTMGGNA